MSTFSDTVKSRMIEALTASLGVVTTACKKVGIDRSTHYKYYKEDAEYRKAVDDIADVALDFAESMLHQQIQGGEVSSTIFYLKTKGKKRGYIERTENEILTPKPLIIDWLNNDSSNPEATGSEQDTAG